MLPKKVDEKRPLESMGFETANIHVGSEAPLKDVRRDIERKRPDWLYEAMKKMTHSVVEDFEDWRTR